MARVYDWARVARFFGFVLRSVPRNPLVAAFAAALVLGLTAVLVLWAPRKYEVVARLLTQQDQTLAQLGNPMRAFRGGDDDPTRSAADSVLTRDHLDAMVKSAGLVEKFEQNRNPLLRLKDRLLEAVFGPVSAADRAEMLEQALEKKLWVITDGDTVVIKVVWSDPEQARQLVELTQAHFLAARRAQEVLAIDEAIKILQTHATETEKGIVQATNHALALGEKLRKLRPRAPRPRLPARLSDGASAQDLAQLKFMIRTKRRAALDLEQSRGRRLTELQTTLAEQRVIYSATHPAVIDIERRIAALQREAGQVAMLKRDEDALLDEYRNRGGRDLVDLSDMGGMGQALGGSSAGDDPLGGLLPDADRDPAMVAAMEQLRIATARYQELLLRIDAARIERDSADAELKYRYTVVQPARTPRRPISPQPLALALGGLLGAVVCAFFAAAARDISSGRLIEAWQIEAELGVPLLAQLSGDER